MRFDIVSFLIGFVSASVIAFVLYRLRGRITAMRRTAETQAGSTRQFITSSSESRYYGDLVKTLKTAHIAGDVVPLTEIYVEPRFMRAIEVADPLAEKPNDVFHVVPIIPEMPAVFAPYNIESYSINDLRTGETHLALLGLPGSGRSTALAILSLIAADEIKLADLMSLESDEVFEDEIKDLPPAEREERIKQRKEVEERALAHLQQMQTRRDKDDEASERLTVDFHRLLPVLVHLRDIDLRPETYGAVLPTETSDSKADGKASTGKSSGRMKLKQVPLDPAEPLVKALQHRASAITASALPRMVYNRLTAGTCLVMIDGYDDLPAEERPVKLAWLKQFMAMYGSNFIIVTGPVTGYDPLVNLGLTPIYLRPWMDTDYERLIQRWTLAWPTIAGTPKKPAPLPEERTVRRVSISNRGRAPLDVTLKVWAAFSGDEQETGRRGRYDFYVRRNLEQREARPAVEKLAAAMLDRGGVPLTKDQIKEIITPALVGTDGKPVANADDVINKLINRSELMIDWPGDCYSFIHPLITGYLASEALAKADPAALSAAVDNPAWEWALPFASIQVPMDAAATQRLGSAPDLLYSSLFSLATWLTDSPPNAPWRADVFKRLTAALLAVNQYPAIRERALAALVTSRDKGITFIMRQALKSSEASIRRLGCIGLGAYGDTEGIKDLSQMLNDQNPDVQLAAGLALGAIGSEAALENMLQGFINGEQPLQQAVAEALAAIPGEGHAVLRDAMTQTDIMVRRAALFGLARVRAGWALALLYRTMMEDAESYVRTGAEIALQQVQRPDQQAVLNHPEADKLAWLVAWAAQKGEGVPAGQTARQVLIRVLQEGDTASKIAAARTLANLGHVSALKPLYSALKDRDEKVRAAVYESLAELQNRLGEELPAVV